MRNIFALTIAMFVVLLAAFYYAFYTPALVQKAAPAFIGKYLKEVSLNSLKIGGQSIAYPQTLKLYHIDAQIQWKNQTYQIQIAELDFLNFQTFFNDQKQALVEVSGLSVYGKNLGLADASMSLTVNLEEKAFNNCEIVLRDAQIEAAPYRLTRAQGRIAFSRENFKIFEFNAAAYGGKVHGNIEWVFMPKGTETAFFEFTDIKTSELVSLNKRIFSRITGELSGTLRLSRIQKLVTVLVVFAEIPRGGTLAAGLVKKISGYITDEETLGKMTRAIQENGALAFDSAQFRILGLNENVAGVTVSLVNKKANLNINETINVDMARILSKFDYRK